jgi:hypothetical protein
LSCEHLREFSKKFETVLMEYSGAGGELIHEKNQKQKSCDTVPLRFATGVVDTGGKCKKSSIIKVLII